MYMYVYIENLLRWDSSCIDSVVTFKDWCKLTIKLINSNHLPCQSYEG